MKHVAAYRQLKPIYDRYQASKDKEKFLRGYEREIILFEAAARECKRLGAVPLPSAERMQAEMDALTARREALTAERQKARREEQDYAAVRRNVEEFLSPPRQAVRVSSPRIRPALWNYGKRPLCRWKSHSPPNGKGQAFPTGQQTAFPQRRPAWPFAHSPTAPTTAAAAKIAFPDRKNHHFMVEWG